MRTARWQVAAAAMISCGTAALRWGQAGESLWLDELHTAWACLGSLDEVAARAAIGNQSPLYFWLLWLLVRLLGASELALRLPSLLAGALLPLAVFWLARRWQQPAAGLAAAGLIAIDRGLIFTATEARPYALVQLLAVAYLGVTAELAATRRWPVRVAWITLAAVLFYLHYTAALVIAAAVGFAVAAAWQMPGQSGSGRWFPAVDVTLVAIACLPAGAHLLAVFARRGNWASFVGQEPFWVLFQWWPLALGSLYLIAAVAIDSWRREQPPEPIRDCRPRNLLALAVLAWLLIPAVSAWLLTEMDFARLFYPRYLAASAPAAVLVGACSMELAPWQGARWLLRVGLIGVCLWSSGIAAQLAMDGRIGGDRHEDFRSAVAWLNNRVRDDRLPVLVYCGFIEADGLTGPHDPLLEDYCLAPVTSLYRIAAERADLIPLSYNEPGQLAPGARSLLVDRGGAWLVARGGKPLARRIATQLLTELNRAAVPSTWQILQAQSFDQVQVLLLRPLPRASSPGN